MSAVIVRNEIVHYEVLGRGRPVICLHSWVGSWRDWIQTMQAISSTYRCYALDLWGFGDTAKAPGRYRIDEQARLVEEFMDSLGIRKIAVLGHGLGGVVAARFALEHPKVVDRLMLVNTPILSESIRDRLQTAAAADLGLWIYTGLPNAETFRREAEKADIAAVRDALDGIGQESFARLTDELRIPCLSVRCENDPAVDPRPLPFQIDRPGSIHQVTLETGGHHPMLREPVVFSRLVTDFLALKSGESPASLQLKDEWKRRFR
jgi:pimeloyl-ACP methyl ester carboxylesterase